MPLTFDLSCVSMQSLYAQITPDFQNISACDSVKDDKQISVLTLL